MDHLLGFLSIGSNSQFAYLGIPLSLDYLFFALYPFYFGFQAFFDYSISFLGWFIDSSRRNILTDRGKKK